MIENVFSLVLSAVSVAEQVTVVGEQVTVQARKPRFFLYSNKERVLGPASHIEAVLEGTCPVYSGLAPIREQVAHAAAVGMKVLLRQEPAHVRPDEAVLHG